jgi:LPS sulfotransferase NodH
MLRSTKVVGNPGELRDKKTPVLEWAQNRDTDPYGVKLNYLTFRRLWPAVSEGERENAKYIWLTRDDLWRQAISLYRSQSTGIWNLGKKRETPVTYREVPFSMRKITSAHSLLCRQNEQWRQHFEQAGIDPLHVTYEQMVDDPVSTVRQVVRYLGIQQDVGVNVRSHRIMRDDITEEWMKRIRAAM